MFLFPIIITLCCVRVIGGELSFSYVWDVQGVIWVSIRRSVSRLIISGGVIPSLIPRRPLTQLECDVMDTLRM